MPVATQGRGDQDQSPSPPPSRPISLAPGIRASLLQKVYNDALSHTLRVCSYTNFAACFPTPAKHVPEALDGLHRDFVGRLEDICKTEFSELLEDRDVVPGLNELDTLIADAKRRKERAETAEGGDAVQLTPPTPPHLLSPSALLAGHLAPFLTAQTNALTEQLDNTHQSNEELAEAIKGQRETIDGLIGGLEKIVRDLEGAAGALSGEEMVEVRAELQRAATAPGNT